MTRRIEVHNAFDCTDLDWSGAMCGGTTMHSSPKLSLLAVRPRFSHAALAHETSLGAKSHATIEMCAAERAMGTRVVACHAELGVKQSASKSWIMSCIYRMMSMPRNFAFSLHPSPYLCPFSGYR